MRILALETSSLRGSVAGLEDGKVVKQDELAAEQRSAQSLAPGVQRLLGHLGWTAKSLDLIAVTRGPGSFTGLRVGLITAKCLCYGTGAQIVGVDTLAVIGRQAIDHIGKDHLDRRIVAVLNAYRQQVFVAEYAIEASQMETVKDSRIEDLSDWLENLSDEYLCGPLLGRIKDKLPESAVLSDAANWDPQAATVGRLGYEQFSRADVDDFWTLGPTYLRKSAAEEKR